MYDVYGVIPSRAFRVLWALEELEQPYTLHETPPRSKEILALNPSGKIPAVKVGDAVLTDSTAIITFLADKYGGLTFPAGTVERAQQDALTGAIIDDFDAVLWAAAKHSFILPEEKRLLGLKDTLKWEFTRAEAAMGARLGDQPFLMGDQITIPDVILTHCLGWAITAKFGISDERLSAYLERNKARPAYKRARKEG